MTSSRRAILIAVAAGFAVVLILGGIWLRLPQRDDAAPAAKAAEGEAQARAARPSPRLGGRRMTGRARAGSGDRGESTNAPAGMSESQMALLDFFLRMRSGQPVKLTREEVDEWLKEAGRSAVNLVAASQLTDDPALLEEAARKFPGDPRVQMQVLLKGVFPEERQRWLAAFKLSSPENALANYLAARDAFKAGQPDLAMQELQQAALKPGMDLYAFDLQQAHESAWATSGYPMAAAQFMGLLGSQIPTIGPLNEVAGQAADLAAKYRQGGDAASADALAANGVQLARRINGGAPTVLQELVGMGIENRFLQPMSPDAVAPGGTQTVAARKAELQERQQTVVKLLQSFDETAAARLSEDDMEGYFERVHTDGGYEALRWLRGRLDER